MSAQSAVKKKTAANKVKAEWFEAIIDANNRKIKVFMVQTSESEIYCKACEVTLNVKSRGKASVTAHIATVKHKENDGLFFQRQPPISQQQASNMPSTSNMSSSSKQNNLIIELY